jgi:hypothetical protein
MLPSHQVICQRPARAAPPPPRRRCPPTFHSAFIDGSHYVNHLARHVVFARRPVAHARSPAIAPAVQPLPRNSHFPTARRRPVPDRLCPSPPPILPVAVSSRLQARCPLRHGRILIRAVRTMPRYHVPALRMPMLALWFCSSSYRRLPSSDILSAMWRNCRAPYFLLLCSLQP